MKLFVWLLTLALGAFCLTCMAIGTWVWHDQSHPEVSAPGFTTFFFAPPTVALFVPIPFIIYAVILTRRGEVTATAALRFAGFVALSAATLLYLTAIAAALPYVCLCDKPPLP